VSYKTAVAGTSEAAEFSALLLDDTPFGVSGDPLQCESFDDFRAKLIALATEQPPQKSVRK